MHPTLRLPNALDEIFSHLHEVPHDPESGKTGGGSLFAAALVCRQWVEFALDALWCGVNISISDRDLMDLLGAAREWGHPVSVHIYTWGVRSYLNHSMEECGSEITSDK
jgi:hypothetical protein